MSPQINLDYLCGNVMNMGLNDNENGENQSKSADDSGFGQNSTLDN